MFILRLLRISETETEDMHGRFIAGRCHHDDTRGAWGGQGISDDGRSSALQKTQKCDFGYRKRKLELEIAGVKFFKNMVILKFKGIDDINDVEKYRKKSLYVTRENAVKLKKDEYFIADLIGMKVSTDEGEELGTLSDVMQTGANDVYVISMTDGEEVLVPAIRDCIRDVDVEQGQMCVHLLPGLLDINRK